MKYFVFATFCLAVTVAMPFVDIENENRVRYYVVPISREKRQLDNDHHRLDGSASVTKTFDPNGHGPYRFGGGLDYTDKDSGLGAFVSAETARGYGTDVNAGLKYNILHGKDFGLDVAGQYSRHFGGSGGTGPPNAGVLLNGHWRF